ncbi:c-Myc-binding protein isoform X2 [Takifugu rubripes]|uniref:c-Myc-binding protein isoform X2 n=1 Tax=Takifugu rubripes TaxID=31033 RepID=UPI000298E7E5|nr:c-Myc-binding protein isoform X2 [Takifugu rubripes]|eukprot:XP_003965710.1 PREDICTED: C-Myc-binding protein [Takifugu rubripes]
MAHYRAPDSKREQFRRYLEKAGVVDSLTSVLVALYEHQDRPSNPLEFLKESMGAVGMASTEVNALQQEVNDLRQRCAALEEENRDLKAQLQHYKQDEPTAE